MSLRRYSGLALTTILVASASGGAVFGQAQDAEPQSFDGLVLVESDQVDEVYVDPEADFSGYESVMLEDASVAFKKNWQRDQNRSRTIRITSSDMERIKADVARLFNEVFTETLEENDGYEIVETAGDNVLLLRPAIIDLEITTPDTMSAGRSRTYTTSGTSAGRMTLYLELYDSLSGDILARATDRRRARRSTGRLTLSTRVENVAEARRMFGAWAGILRERLDEITRQ